MPDALRRLVAGSSIPVTISDPNAPDQPLIFANQAFADLTGYAAHEIVGHNCRFLQGPDTDQDVRHAIAASLAAARPIVCTLRNYTKRGTPFDNFLIIRSLTNALGEPLYYLGCQYVVQHSFDERSLVRHLDAETAIVDEFRQSMSGAHKAIDASQRLNAEALFTLAASHLRRAERQAVLELTA